MERDPLVVARLAAEREDENWRFRTFLKHSNRMPRGQLNRIAEEFGRAAEAQMDCTACGACCRDNCVPVDDAEQKRLAQRLGISQSEFAAKYVTVEDGDPESVIDARPCPFLDGNRCSVYEDRPDACRGYPYVGGDIATRTIGIIERAGTCPIIYEMLERLKDAVGFRRYNR